MEFPIFRSDFIYDVPFQLYIYIIYILWEQFLIEERYFQSRDFSYGKLIFQRYHHVFIILVRIRLLSNDIFIILKFFVNII